MPSSPQDPAADADPPLPADPDATPAPEPTPDPVHQLDHLAVDDTDHLLQVAHRVSELHDRIAAQTKSEVNGLFELLGSKRRLLIVNFMAGLARGAGFFLGVTLIGGLLIGGFAFFFDTTTSAIGLEDVTFRSLMRTFAEEAIEAKKVWEDVNEQETVDDPAVDSSTTDENRSPPPPRDG